MMPSSTTTTTIATTSRPTITQKNLLPNIYNNSNYEKKREFMKEARSVRGIRSGAYERDLTAEIPSTLAHTKCET